MIALDEAERVAKEAIRQVEEMYDEALHKVLTENARLKAQLKERD